MWANNPAPAHALFRFTQSLAAAGAFLYCSYLTLPWILMIHAVLGALSLLCLFRSASSLFTEAFSTLVSILISYRLLSHKSGEFYKVYFANLLIQPGWKQCPHVLRLLALILNPWLDVLQQILEHVVYIQVHVGFPSVVFD